MKFILGRTVYYISRLGLLAVVFLAAGSCGEAGMLMPNVDRVDDASIVTGSAGVIVAAGSEMTAEIALSSQFRSSEQTPIRMEAYLFDAEGEEVAVGRFSAEDLSDDSTPPFRLPDDLESGYYEIRYRLFQQDRLLASHVRPFFVADDTISLGGISVYPSTIEPDSQGILQLGIQRTQGSESDPYIVWRFDGRIIESGSLSSGLDEILIRSPDRNGVYSVRADVYPFAPTDDAPYSFPAVNQQRGEVVVSSDSQARSHELQPVQSYYSLLRLNGNLRDTGMRNEGDTQAQHFHPVGEQEPPLVIDQGRLGHQFSGDDAIETNGSVFPSRGSMPDSFTLTFRGRFSLPEEREQWVEVVDGDPRVEIYSEDGSMYAVVGMDGQRFEMPREMIPANEAVQWSFSYLPEGSRAYGMWLINGMLVHLDTIDTPNGSDPAGEAAGEAAAANAGDAARTIIGHGIIGVMEEFGIYYQDEQQRSSINLNEFERAMELQYPHTLIYAEGFAADAAKEDGILSEQEFAIQGGSLIIPPGETLYLPEVFFENSDIIFELAFADPSPVGHGSLSIRTLSADGAEPETIDVALEQEMLVRVGIVDSDLVIRRQPERRLTVPGVHGVSAAVVNSSGGEISLNLRHVIARHAEQTSSASLFTQED